MKNFIMILFILGISKVASAQWITSGTDIYNLNIGNVGIGTTNTQGYKLSVAGDIKVGPDGAYTNFVLGNEPIPLSGYNQTSYLVAPTIPGSGAARSAFRFKSNSEPGFGSNLMDVIVDGNLGIGTTSPTNFGVDYRTVTLGGNSGGVMETKSATVTARLVADEDVAAGIINVATNHPLQLWTNASERMRITAAGYVGIGTATPDSKLTVAGKIHSHEVKVSVAAGADFVFDNGYKLRSLAETEQYINKNKHLPEIASAEDMMRDGLELGEMNIKLLQKIEELTLYIIDLKKEKDKEYEDSSFILKEQSRKIDALEKKLLNIK